jgi:hypothetical protein
MKRRETTPGGSVKESVVPERSIDKDRLTKRHNIGIGYPMKIPEEVVEGVEKSKYETLGCCEISQLHRKMRHKGRRG